MLTIAETIARASIRFDYMRHRDAGASPALALRIAHKLASVRAATNNRSR